MPCVMTFRRRAPIADGIISCLHWIRLSLAPDPNPKLGKARYRDSGKAEGAGTDINSTGVDDEKASNVEIREG
jgi:hypothetical protein